MSGQRLAVLVSDSLEKDGIEESAVGGLWMVLVDYVADTVDGSYKQK